VPEEASDLVAAYSRGAELRPVVRLRTLRRRIELADERGASVGEVVDDEVSVMDGSRVAARFREVEVEAATPEPDPRLEAVVSRLAVAGASPTDGTPKYQQALGPRASAPPDVIVPELGPDASVVEVVRAAIAASVVRLLGTTPASALATISRTSIRPAWPRAGSARTCGRSAKCSTRNGTRNCARSSGGSAQSSAPSGTSTCSSSA
jgi:hypothetical protein